MLKFYELFSIVTDENSNMKKMGDITLRQEDVLHIPGLGFDGLIGYSPIAMARNAVGMTMACEEYGASFFANGANPGGVVINIHYIRNLLHFISVHPSAPADRFWMIWPGVIRQLWSSPCSPL